MWLELLCLLVGLISSTGVYVLEVFGITFPPVVTGYLTANAVYVALSLGDMILARRYGVEAGKPLPTGLKAVWVIGGIIGVSIEYLLKDYPINLPYLKGIALYLGSQILGFLAVLTWVKVADLVHDSYMKRHPKTYY